MAGLSAMGESELPSWNSSPTDVQSVRLSQELGEKPDPEILGQETGTGVLLMHIFRTLQRIEARLEGQDKRLDMMEESIRAEETEEHMPGSLRPGFVEMYKDRISQSLNDSYGSYLERPVDEQRGGTVSGNVFPNDQGNSVSLQPKDRSRSAYSLSVYSFDLRNQKVAENQATESPQPDPLQPRAANSVQAFPYEHMKSREMGIAPSKEALDVAGTETADKSLSVGRFKRPFQNMDVAIFVYEKWRYDFASKTRGSTKPKQKGEANQADVSSKPMRSVRGSLRASCRSAVDALPSWRINLDFPTIPR